MLSLVPIETHLEDFVVCLPSDLCGTPALPNNENVNRTKEIFWRTFEQSIFKMSHMLGSILNGLQHKSCHYATCSLAFKSMLNLALKDAASMNDYHHEPREHKKSRHSGVRLKVLIILPSQTSKCWLVIREILCFWQNTMILLDSSHPLTSHFLSVGHTNIFPHIPPLCVVPLFWYY